MKSYEIILHTLSPVYIGSGNEIKKTEYIFSKESKKVYIPNLKKMYEELRKKGLEESFVQFFLKNQNRMKYEDRESLRTWLEKNNILESEYKNWSLYEMDCGDFLEEKGEIGIQTFIKDPYGLPYVPGSSIKGMLRTILLIYEMDTRRKPDFKTEWKQGIRAAIEKANIKTDDRNIKKQNIKTAKKQLNDIATEIETEYFHTLHRKKDKPGDKANAVNDCMAGVIVSDSLPLEQEEGSVLVLCQKVDMDVEQSTNEIDILRECIKPGIDIRFQLTFETGFSSFSIKKILDAIQYFNEYYYESYLRYFSVDRPAANTVWLGGGTGYLTKTITYSLYGENERVRNTAEVFRVVLPEVIYRNHMHDKDVLLGVSPHMLKCTQYEGKRYQMGQCEFRLAEKI